MTCFVLKAVDEWSIDESGQPQRVALKLMRNKAQYLREINLRKYEFEPEFVMIILGIHPSLEELENRPDIVDIDVGSGHRDTGTKASVARADNAVVDDAQSVQELAQTGLMKSLSEQLFCFTMPLSDRNMFTALKVWMVLSAS